MSNPNIPKPFTQLLTVGSTSQAVCAQTMPAQMLPCLACCRMMIVIMFLRPSQALTINLVLLPISIEPRQILGMMTWIILCHALPWLLMEIVGKGCARETMMMMMMTNALILALIPLAGGEDWRFFRYCNGFGVDVE